MEGGEFVHQKTFLQAETSKKVNVQKWYPKPSSSFIWRVMSIFCLSEKDKINARGRTRKKRGANFLPKNKFYEQKHQKKPMFKNGVKSCLTLLLKVMSIFCISGEKKNPSYMVTLE